MVAATQTDEAVDRARRWHGRAVEEHERWRVAWVSAGAPREGPNREAVLRAWEAVHDAENVLVRATALAMASRWARWAAETPAPPRAQRLHHHARAIGEAAAAGASPMDLIALVARGAAELSAPRSPAGDAR